MIVLTAAALVTPEDSVEHPVLVMDEHTGAILECGDRGSLQVPTNAKHFDYGDGILSPGFIDMHVHGSAGHDVMEGTDLALGAVESFLAKHGVTSYCPTTVTASVDDTLFSLEKLGEAIRSQISRRIPGRTRPVGIHLEGPFISRLKCGVHPIADIATPSVELFERFWQASNGAIALMTIAPELPNAEEVIRTACSYKVIVSLGHSDAEVLSTKNGIAAGARHATHTFNAMRSLNHRDPGILGVILSDDRLSADIVADGIHVAPEIVKLFLAAKGVDRAVLITDAISAAGMPDGRYRLGSFEVELKGEQCSMNGHLAGSVLTMDAAVRNVMKFADWTLLNTLKLATLNPARILGINARKGALAPGMDADVVVLNKSGHVLDTFIGAVKV